MSFTSIRCPNCAGNSSMLIGENQYQCKFCDNTFNYADPNTPKITKNITVQESNHCPICGRGVTVGTSTRCMKCGISDFCSNCVFELDSVFQCKTCIVEVSRNCPICGKPIICNCCSCWGFYESGKINKSQVSRSCNDHVTENKLQAVTSFNYDSKPGGYDVDAHYFCNHCESNMGGGLVCFNCVILEKKFRGNKYFCKFCGSRIELITSRRERNNKL